MQEVDPWDLAERLPASLLREWRGFYTWEWVSTHPDPTKWDPPDVKREKLERKAARKK